MHLGLIWAEARGGAIGRDGDMPWHLPEDLAHFKRATEGAPVIMGRRTWESLPERFRPLPGRTNIVVTRDESYEARGATVVGSLDAALRALEPPGGGEAALASLRESGAGRAWVMGGGQLYRAAMPIADEILVTRIELDVEDADTFAPEIGPEWELSDAGAPQVSKTGLEYRIERFTRRP